tara:strand:- start:615 stop:2453 length:1839 start_codon:yes stop_codon:yes gene_type:complete
VADYTVNLRLAVQGSKELEKLNKKIDKTRKQLNKAEIGSAKFDKSIKNLIKTETNYGQALNRRTKAIDNALRAATGMQTVEQREHQLLIRGNKLRDLRARKERALNRQRMATRGITGAIGSGIIGGGFPLLFGQGPIAAAGGALGGVAGGALSAIPGMGQMGFALSIAGTAIGSAMEDLNQALRKPEENIDNLIGKLGLVGTPTEKMAKELEKLGLKGSAAKLVMDKFNERFGNSPEIIKENSEKMLEFKNKINELGTAITLFLGKALIPFIDSITGAMTQGKLLKALEAQEGTNFSKTQQSIVNQSQLEAQRLFKTTNQGKDIGKTFSQIFDERLTFNLKKAVGSPDVTPNLLTGTPQGGGLPTNPNQDLIDKTKFNKEILPLQQALEIEQKRLTTSSEKLTLMQEQFELTNLENELELLKLDNKGTENDLHGDTIKKLEAQINLQEQVVNNAKALADPFREVSNIIAQDIGDGIKGLIRGTETLGSLLNNVLNKLAEAFLNMAIFGDIGGSFTPGLGLLGKIFKANGGPVKGGGSYIVGERGPEVFSPGVSGTITPNHALGGSTNVVVNVDASGSNIEGDEQQGRELGRLISVAVQSEILQQKRPGGMLA